jgi:hypothetical protein
MADNRQPQRQKGNPAHKRMSNANLKARRAASWARGQKRKAARRTEQKARETANAERLANGLLTPWQHAKSSRKVRRTASLVKQHN